MTIDDGIDEYKANDLSADKLDELIVQGKSFKVIHIKDMASVVKQLEKAIEDKNLTCRIYTEYRSTTLASALIPTGITQAIGLSSAIGIGIHNLATYNPHYEIGKNKLNNTLTIIRKRA